MSLFFYCLTDKGKVNLCEVAHRLGIDVKKLEAEMERRDSGDIPPAHIENLEEIDRLMRQKPKGRVRANP